MAEVLTQPFELAWTYTRSTGPLLGGFFAGLRDGALLGVRTPSGRVLVPPLETDPDTGRDLGPEALVPVGPGGVVTSWTWVEAPLPDQPGPGPFAYALVRPDGADTALLSVVRAPREALRTGLRVRAAWAEVRTGSLQDLAGFEPEEGA